LEEMRVRINMRLSGVLFFAVAIALCAASLPGATGAEPVQARPVVMPGTPVKGGDANEVIQAIPVEKPRAQAIIIQPVEEEVAEPVVEELPPLKGPKKSIGVVGFEEKPASAGDIDLGETIADMITAGLIETDRFIVVERSKIRDLIQQQDLAASGKIAKTMGESIEKLLPSQIGVSGTLTQVAAEETPAEETPKPVTEDALFTVTLRIFETGSAQVLFSTSFDTPTPIDAIVKQAVHVIALEAANIPWRGSIVLVQRGDVYINCGKREGIAPGQQFVVHSKGNELLDPITGELLGVQQETLGKISVVDVRDKYSIAKVEDGERFHRGDELRLP
jgi:curli biogenesis system outer membrane secretion channel CsgG